MSDTDQINGMLLQIKRDELGWAVSDMATSACLSVKQVKQIEQGGISAFYSPTVKLTAAKKMAHILGVSEDELFGRIVPFAPLSRT
ncbi:MAG: XRE family transcriptional regulator [Betaproteobacteria bacterium]|nr:XRE family transcriptional regulator [Betaproteobacteria bacterium]